MFVQTMMDAPLGVKHIDHLIDGVGEPSGEGYNFVVLTHLMKEMLRIWPENIGFGFLRPQTKYFKDIDHQGILHTGVADDCRQVRIRCHCEKWDHMS